MFLYLPCFADDDDAPVMFMSWYFDKDIAHRILTAKEKTEDLSPFLWDVRLDADAFCIDTFPSQCVYVVKPGILCPKDVWVTDTPPFAMSYAPEWQEVDHMLIRFDDGCVDFEFKISNVGLGEQLRYISTETPYSFFENLISGNLPTEVVDHNWGV